MNDKVDTSALLARVDIVDVIDKYVPLKKAGTEFEACCPFHSEKSPSFKVSPSKQIYHCFGCGANGDAITFLRNYAGMEFREAVEVLGGAAALPDSSGPVQSPARVAEDKPTWSPILPVPVHATPAPKAHPYRGLPEMQWAYKSAQGALLGYVLRFRKSDGGKEVVPLVWAVSEAGVQEWRWASFPKPRPLYGLDRLAAKPESLVLLVEGEKCADVGDAELPELVVMAWPGGGKADDKVDWSPLAGRKVMTWADADCKREKLSREESESGVDPLSKPFLPPEAQEGYQTMLRIRERLRGLNCKLWDVQLPPQGVKPDGWDIADAAEEGLRGKQLADFIRANLVRLAVPAVPAPMEHERNTEQNGTEQQEPQKQRRESPALIEDVGAWLSAGQPQEWIVDGLIQRGNLYAMTAVTNHGKTAIALLMGLSVASGKLFGGRVVRQGKVLILCGENPDGFRTRLNATLEHLGLEPGDVNGVIEVIPRALPLAAVVERILAEARARGGEYVMVIIDTSISYFSGDNEDDNLQARTHAWNLRALSQLPGSPAIIANAHPTKSATKDSLTPRGGGAFLNEIDTNLTVWSEGEVATLHWHHKKRGPDFDPMVFEFHGKSVIEHGISVPTVVASYISEERAHDIKRARNMDEDRLLYALQHHPDETFASWATLCGWNGEKAKSKVSRVMDRLKEDKLVQRNRKGWVLTPSGERESTGIR